MAIISAIPNVLTSGNDVTASQLNTNFQHIADQVNANAIASVTSANITAALGYTPADAATVAGIETLLEAL